MAELAQGRTIDVPNHVRLRLLAFSVSPALLAGSGFSVSSALLAGSGFSVSLCFLGGGCTVFALFPAPSLEEEALEEEPGALQGMSRNTHIARRESGRKGGDV